MVKFHRKFENRAIQIGRDNSILIKKTYQFTVEFCMVLGVRCDDDIFKLTASAQSINREVYVHDIKIIARLSCQEIKIMARLSCQYIKLMAK